MENSYLTGSTVTHSKYSREHAVLDFVAGLHWSGVLCSKIAQSIFEQGSAK